MSRNVDYRDSRGRTFRVILPDGAPDGDAPRGMPVGPPDLTPLGLPEDVMVRLHNQLHARGLLTARDVRLRTRDVVAALQAAFRVDATSVIALYHQEDSDA